MVRIDSNAFAGNSSLSSIAFPTTAIEDFAAWQDNSSPVNTYQPGQIFTNFAAQYTVFTKTILTGSDVEMTGGTITNYLGSAEYIIIPDTVNISGTDVRVTAIGANAFLNDAAQSVALKSVEIPNSVTGIGFTAFRNNALTSVTIPTGVTTIGPGAFQTNALTSVSIPNSVTSIQRYAFQGNALTSVTIPSSVTSIGIHAFESNSLTSVTIEENSELESIGADAFLFNTNLTSITFPSSAVEHFVHWRDNANNIYESGDAFSNYALTYTVLSKTILTSSDITTDGQGTITNYTGSAEYIIIPESIGAETITGIGASAFKPDADSDTLKSVTIANTITSIGDSAFRDNALDTLTIPDGVTIIGDSAFHNNALDTLVIPSAVTSIGVGAFGDNALASVTIESNSKLETIGSNAFLNNSLSNGITFPTTAIEYFAVWQDNSSPVNTYQPGQIFSNFAAQYTVLTKTILTESDVQMTGGTITSYIGSAEYIVIPDTINVNGTDVRVTAIGDNAFKNKGLKSVEIPNSVTSIGYTAFFGNALTSVTIPTGVTTIGPGAFQGNALTSVSIPNSVTSIQRYAFQGNALTSVTIPSSVTSIGIHAFQGNALTSVIIEANSELKTIGANAFLGNASLSSITFPSSAVEHFVHWRDNANNIYESGDAFSNYALTYTVLSKTILTSSDITTDGQGTITNYTGSAEYIIIPESIGAETITGIGASAFKPDADSDTLKSVTIANTITSIGDSAFRDNALDTLTIPDGVTIIGDSAFHNNALDTLVIPSAVTSIGVGAFGDNALASVTIESNSKLETIGSNAFLNNSLSNGITFPTTAIEYFAVWQDNSSPVNTYQPGQIFSNFAAQYTVLTKTILTESDVEMTGGTITSYIGSAEYIVIPDTINVNGTDVRVTAIGANAFKNKGLKSVEIPNSVTGIGYTAFFGNALTSVTIPTGVTTIGPGAFQGNALTSVSIPNSVTSIQRYAFQGNALTSVTIPSSVTSIGIHAFEGNALTSVIIEANSELKTYWC